MSTRRFVIGVMGRGENALAKDVRAAEELGERIASTSQYSPAWATHVT